MTRKARATPPDPADPARLSGLRALLADASDSPLPVSCLDAEPALFAEALTHASLANQRAIASNQRLEMLGDAVVNLVAASLVFERLRAADEGELTRVRWGLVRTESLAALARKLGLGRWLATGLGAPAELPTLDGVLADTFEAVVGALYRAGGLPAAKSFAGPLLSAALDGDGQAPGDPQDAKTRLQILTQAKLGLMPVYVVVATEGPDHARRFDIEARVGDAVAGRGQGPSKKAAEQGAAERALATFPTWSARSLSGEGSGA